MDSWRYREDLIEAAEGNSVEKITDFIADVLQYLSESVIA
jgi:hypothetical protein